MSTSKKKVVIASEGEFRIVLVKNGLPRVGGGFSASVGEYHNVPVKKEGRRSLGR